MIINIFPNAEWNKRPSTTLNSPSVETFKDRLKAMPIPGTECCCAFLTSAFILQTFHVSHKEINYWDSHQNQRSETKLYPCYVALLIHLYVLLVHLPFIECGTFVKFENKAQILFSLKILKNRGKSFYMCLYFCLKVHICNLFRWNQTA